MSGQNFIKEEQVRERSGQASAGNTAGQVGDRESFNKVREGTGQTSARIVRESRQKKSEWNTSLQGTDFAKSGGVPLSLSALL